MTVQLLLLSGNKRKLILVNEKSIIRTWQTGRFACFAVGCDWLIVQSSTPRCESVIAQPVVKFWIEATMSNSLSNEWRMRIIYGDIKFCNYANLTAILWTAINHFKYLDDTINIVEASLPTHRAAS